MKKIKDYAHLYGLIGYPLTHSFSQDFFNNKFKSESLLHHLYTNFSIPTIEDFPEIIENHKNLKGLNVTIPYKEVIIPFLDALSEEAAMIKAVNVIAFDNNQLIGFNSDVYGFERSIFPLLQSYHKKALVLGTGGASKAVIFVLDKLGIPYMYVSRTPSADQLGYEQLDECITEYRIIINTTPVGMYPDIDQYPDLPYDKINSDYLFYDLVYNPEETKFLREGKMQGAIIKNGLEMLILQAQCAWKIWNKTD